MNEHRYRAAILRDASGWATNTVRLMVAESRGPGAAYLLENGLWVSVEEGSLIPPEAGLVLPAGAIEAIAEAIASHQGDAGHAATEARVLREWLKAERDRVDAALHRAITS